MNVSSIHTCLYISKFFCGGRGWWKQWIHEYQYSTLSRKCRVVLLHTMQPYGRVEDPLAGFCGDSGEPLHYITRKHFYELMKARQDVPLNEMAWFGIDIFASLRSTYHIAWTFNYDFFYQHVIYTFLLFPYVC